ncbi:MAG: serine/threonine-protein kinase [Acidobacteriota bacterium]
MAEAQNPAPQKIGKYEIVATLGKGAMGVVYRAKDPFIGREVALKTMLKELVEGEEEQQRFFREAQAAGNLKHANIVTIYELGLDGDTAFIAMELLEGSDLKKMMRDQPNLPIAKKLEVVAEICEGLDYAHKRGIVHRDIKPANIHIGDDGAVKIMDFGIARVSTSEMTKTGMVLGTVSYMSPEQVAGAKVDGRSDLFAVGVILYELITNQKPFPGDTISTIIHKIISKDPEPFSTDGLPPGIDTVVHKALAKSADDRYPTAGEMAGDLRVLLQGDPRLLSAAQNPVPIERTVLRAPSAAGATRTGPTQASARTMTSKTMPAGKTAPPQNVAATRQMASATAAIPAEMDDAPAPKKGGAGILIGVVAVGFLFLLLAGGVGAFVLYPRLMGTTTENTPTVTAPPSPTASTPATPATVVTPPATPSTPATPPATMTPMTMTPTTPPATATPATPEPIPTPTPTMTTMTMPTPTATPTQMAMGTPTPPPIQETPVTTRT